MAISTARVQTLVWVLIYGGLLLAALGASLLRGGREWGLGFVAAGGVAVAAGAYLIWFRSRMRPDAAAGEPTTSMTTEKGTIP